MTRLPAYAPWLALIVLLTAAVLVGTNMTGSTSSLVHSITGAQVAIDGVTTETPTGTRTTSPSPSEPVAQETDVVAPTQERPQAPDTALRAVGTVDACTTLNESDTYTLTNDINGTGNCLFLNNNSITVDCAGFEINYSQGVAGHGIVSNFSNITIMNCNIVNVPQTKAHGINLTISNNSFVINNNITIDGSTTVGVFLDRVHNTSVRGNSINSTGTGTNRYGVQIAATTTKAAHNNISDNIIFTNGTTTNFGIYMLDNVHNTTVGNNSISTRGTGADNRGIVLNGNAAGSAMTGNIIANNNIS
ncbi:MAG: right-handed parallel beta-helix repeat-containing protein, partial [Nanoarchaeota archaeon]